jgi:hypothetical protein
MTEQPQLSLGTAAARNLSTTTKTVPQMQGSTPRWLLRRLPWVEVKGGTYRVNRRLTYAIGDGRLTFVTAAGRISVVPQELRELAVLRDVDDEDVLSELAGRFTQRSFEAGEVLAEFGHRVDEVFLLAHGKVTRLGPGEYGEPTVLGVLAGGEHFGQEALLEPERLWEYTIRATTPGTALVLPAAEFRSLLRRFRVRPKPSHNKHGEAAIDLTAGHSGEPDLPGTFVDYELAPREYELSVAQTVLRIHTRVADLYSQPMRLTVEALRERQEHELVNNREFGLLHNADPRQRIQTRSGPPTPYDLDELLSRRRKTRSFFAHPRTIAAFGRECTRRGIYPATVDVDGHAALAWRGVPMLPCDKLPISVTGTSSILAMRTGVEDEGVVGLRPGALPCEHQPGLNVRFMGINEKAVISYLVSAYHSVAVLVPDALGVLENVQLGQL